MADETLRDALNDTISRVLRCEVARDPASGLLAPEPSAKLWAELEDCGATASLLPESAGGMGIGMADALSLLGPAGYFAAPVPLAETMLASWVLAQAGLPQPGGQIGIAPVRRTDRLVLNRSGDGWHLSGVAHGVPWGASVDRLVAVAEADGQDHVVLLERGAWQARDGSNVAGEPRDDLTFDIHVAGDAVRPTGAGQSRETVHAMGALMRATQMAGALKRILDLTCDYARERSQFGRPIGKFQAVQQNIAVLAGQASAARAAAEIGADAAAAGMEMIGIAAAKARAGEAASIGAAIAHQVYGAMGFAQESALHHFTRRLWAWRSEFGGDAYWQGLIGANLARSGADRLWDRITAAETVPSAAH